MIDLEALREDLELATLDLLGEPASPLLTWLWVEPWAWGWYQCVPGGCG